MKLLGTNFLIALSKKRVQRSSSVAGFGGEFMNN